jgi:hypothetical protein
MFAGPETRVPTHDAEALASGLQLFPVVEHTDVVPGQDGSYGVRVFTADGQEAIVPAPQGLLIREADERIGHVAYFFINGENQRMATPYAATLRRSRPR